MKWVIAVDSYSLEERRSALKQIFSVHIARIHNMAKAEKSKQAKWQNGRM